MVDPPSPFLLYRPSVICDVGGNANRIILDNRCRQRTRGADEFGASERMREMQPKAYPVLRRNVESRTRSGAETSSRSRSPHKAGMAILVWEVVLLQKADTS